MSIADDKKKRKQALDNIAAGLRFAITGLQLRWDEAHSLGEDELRNHLGGALILVEQAYELANEAER